VAGRVLQARLIRTRRRGLVIVEALFDDGTAALRAVWYNQAYLQRVLEPGRLFSLYGPVEPRRGRGPELVLQNPQIERLPEGEESETIHTGRVVPIYRKVGSVSPRLLRTLQHRVLEALRGPLPDPLPPELRRRLGLCAREEALRAVHFPEGPEPVEVFNARCSRAHRRLVFEELFLLQVTLALRRRRVRETLRGFQYRTTPETGQRLRQVLPFRLTAAQRRVFREIVEDLRAPYPMNRLLQGDVGSGKTIVAVLAALLAVENGLQAAIMAPTEILAAQHHERLERLLGGRGWRLGLLSQSTRGAERRRLLEALGAGEVDLLVGTHALIQRPVRFKSLGLVVVDEQHRFGVVQRQALLEKGPRPDLLVMTATPIPRTLALTLYGDLDLSVLDEPPPGRQPIQTSIVPSSGRECLYARVRAEAAAGRQIYIITPVIDDADVRGLKAATALAARLARGPLAGIPLGLLHGRLDPEVKSDAMRRFAAGDLKALVATSLVEVGIDVPEATGMVIENAERFGLSQLHQLRGRVGRGPRPSWCALVPSESADAEALERLQAFLGCADGFEVAEADLRLRGSGELFGARQSGLGELKLADLVRHQDLVELARNEAFAWVEAERARGGVVDAGVLEEVRRRWPEHSRWLTEG
jgi:ATP-dependent DNA helicase RecG